MVKFKGGVKIGLAVVVLLAVLGVVYAIVAGGSEVETVTVQQDDITLTVDETGYVQSSRDYPLYATQMARVVALHVATGDTVTRGQILISLENIDLTLQEEQIQAQLDQIQTEIGAGASAKARAEIELSSAEKNLARMETLWQSDAIPEVEYEQAQKAVEMGRQTLNEITEKLEGARAGAENLDRQLQQLVRKKEQLDIIAPTSGVVLDVPVKQGQVVQPGQELTTVAAPGLLEVKADILSDDVAELKPGQQVSITGPVLGGQVLTGLVKQIYPRAEEKQSALGVIQRRVPVLISLEETSQLRPGYEVNVAIQVDHRSQVLVVPREVLRTTATGAKEVLLVRDNRVYHREVQTGLGDGEKVEVISGLEPGDVLVKDGGQDLPEKTKIKPVP